MLIKNTDPDISTAATLASFLPTEGFMLVLPLYPPPTIMFLRSKITAREGRHRGLVGHLGAKPKTKHRKLSTLLPVVGDVEGALDFV